MKTIICIAGPTASGKSAFALKLAKHDDGEVINADALQVYEEMQVLSARPSKGETADIPHHLYGMISMRHRYSTGQWLRAADEKIIDILARGKTPVLVGGTGLYFKALTEGLAHIPQPREEAVQSAQAILQGKGVDGLRTEAERLDAQAAGKVLGDDPQRLLRIVSVAKGTAKPLSEWQAQTKPALPRDSWKGYVIAPKRDVLYEKINTRFGWMMENGGYEEAQRIYHMHLDPGLPAMKAIGLRQVLPYFAGNIDLEQALDSAKRETRRFAKRQMTWLRGNMADWHWLDMDRPDIGRPDKEGGA